MGKFVLPKVYLIGSTCINTQGLKDYLHESGNEEFVFDIVDAVNAGLTDVEILCSLYAKLCYKSLTIGQNENVTRVRDIKSNIEGCFDSGHGSIFEHAQLNFVVKDCSRIFTHELVRHRVGTAFSQTSGRYVSIDNLDMIIDPILSADEECLSLISQHIADTEHLLKKLREKLIPKNSSFSHKKLVTSAIRRLAPNGQSNEIGFSVNLRSIRHILTLRTSAHAEWEIRYVANQIADIIESKWPLMLYGMSKHVVNGQNEWRIADE